MATKTQTLADLRSYDQLQCAASRADFEAARELIPDTLMPGSFGEAAFVQGFAAARAGQSAPSPWTGGGASYNAALGYRAGLAA
jgi:hypothetical protein